MEKANYHRGPSRVKSEAVGFPTAKAQSVSLVFAGGGDLYQMTINTNHLLPHEDLSTNPQKLWLLHRSLSVRYIGQTTGLSWETLLCVTLFEPRMSGCIVLYLQTT